jgi:hypothetical protein
MVEGSRHFVNERGGGAIVEIRHGQLLVVYALEGNGRAFGRWYPAQNEAKLLASLSEAGFAPVDALPEKAQAAIDPVLAGFHKEATCLVRQAGDDAQEAALRDAIMVSEKVEFWGREHDRIPILSSAIVGDGLALLGVQPLNTRPNYYVIRVDSSWAEKPGSEMDHVVGALEAEFGEAWERDEGAGDMAHRGWPAFNGDSGYSWFKIDWPAGLEPDAEAEQELRPGA